MIGGNFKSRYSTAARDIYTVGASKFNADKAANYINNTYHTHISISSELNSQSREEILRRLQNTLTAYREPLLCCFSTQRFSSTEVQTITRETYPLSLSDQAFHIDQDTELFLQSIGLNPQDMRLTALTGLEKRQVMEGLMTVLQAEANHNQALHDFVLPRLHLDIDEDPQLRSQIQDSVPQLRQLGKPPQSPDDIEGRLAQDIQVLLSVEDRLHYSAGAKQIGTFLQGVSSLLPESFKDAENIEKLKFMAGTVLDDMTLLRNGLLSETIGSMTEENAKRFIDTAQNIIQGCHLASARIAGDFPQGVLSVKMTGSDLHHGQSVHIITTQDGEKWVYKPRNIQTDQLVCGQNSLFSMINLLGSSQDISLPTMTFHSQSDAQGEYGYVSFIDNSPDKIIMNEAQANRYFKQLGQLALTCLVLGIADLHHENIMAGASFNAESVMDTRPFLIDAEAAFLPHKIIAPKLSHIELSLYRQSGWTLANNGILSGHDFKELKQMFEKKISLVIPDSIHHSNTYFHCFSEGVSTMKEFLTQPMITSALSQKLQQNLHQLNHIRLIPLATKAFSVVRSNLPAQKETSITKLVRELDKKLTEKGIKLTKPKERTLQFLHNELENDLNNGNIPIMHFDAEFNTITYNGGLIGEYAHGDISQLVTNKAQSMAHADLSTLLKGL